MADLRVQRLATQSVALVAFSIREARHKWTLIASTALSTLLLILLSIAVNLDVIEGTLASAQLLGRRELDIGGIPIGEAAQSIQMGIVLLLNFFGLLAALFVTGNIIPRTLSGGWVDLLVAQPLARPTLLLSRTLGAIVVVALNLAYLVVGSWIILTWKAHFWNAGFLLAGLLILLSFTCFYAGMVLVGVITRSSPVSIMAGFGVWFVGIPLHFLHTNPAWRFAIEDGWRREIAIITSEGLYWLLPKTIALFMAAVNATRSQPLGWAEILSSLPFVIICLGLACWCFRHQDY